MLWGVFIEPLTRGDTDAITMFYGVPFFITSTVHIVFLAFIYLLAFGKWVIKINQGSLIVITGAFPIRTRKEVLPSRITAIKLVDSKVSVEDKIQKHISIETASKTFTFGACINRDLKPFIHTWLQQNIKPS